MNTRKNLNVTKPVTLMNVATIAVKALKKDGRLTNVVESEEINACTVDFKAEIDGEEQDWVLLFKNETHNHPTEIDRSAAQRPASAVPFVTRCPVEAMYMRQCV